MLWLCLHLPLLPRTALADARAQTAVVEQRGSRRWLITPTRHCAAGTALGQALSLEPDLHALPRRPAAEQAALQALAHAVYRYGQPVCAQIQDVQEAGRLPRPLLWVEIGASLSLFGGLDALRDRLCGDLLDTLPELMAGAQIGIAPTRAAAALLACAGQSEPVRNAAQLEAALGALPLSLLCWPTELLQALRGVGLRYIAELWRIPRDTFSTRFGASPRLELDRLLGHAPEPCEALVPPDTFERRFELGAEVEDLERLRFPLKRLCAELQVYLRARDLGLRGASLVLGHAGARQTHLHVQFLDAHREAQRIFDALCERLNRVTVREDGSTDAGAREPLPVRELRLVAEDFAEPNVPQQDLFDPRAGRAQQWAASIERLRARLGDAAVWTVQARADHRPEHSGPRHLHAPTPAYTPAPQDHHRPTLLLREPWPMPAPPLPADTVFERIESGWWDGGDVRRDYTTLDINGGRAWVYREIESGRWYLHGWFS